MAISNRIPKHFRGSISVNQVENLSSENSNLSVNFGYQAEYSIRDKFYGKIAVPSLILVRETKG